ncbi:LysR family transcriptional regulator [Alicycliphilus denitrificans]|uniref:Transcriptional regulator, LysR family n=2 Tax=Alicycliphilus denitrificans TaxID=179636 RepID=F4GGM8_ALIDK|nr:LysR substrate-binding domain-containing protein [Alicycliphilus denitrificans]ADV01227.1 LysR substrate-binding protein [Alicycliphilus denitrificans BC]AEB86253.1 transcriptional regulator, LysR family [Alicycliphilus denitrificans K601]QKD45370.1 LysR family transcriptional regulator [Alicycliphilus denitrificans]GAO24851.1 LysR family transcriptional regulator [Alicycliphilus sp. B1]
MSHALSVLRVLLDDDLFVRVGYRMEPTLRARALHEPVRELLGASQKLLLSHRSFDPAVDERVFRIGLSIQSESMLIAELFADLALSAPRVKLLLSPTSREKAYGALDTEQIDLAIGYLPGGSNWHHRAELHDLGVVCCFHPKLLPYQTPIGLNQYRASRHALISAKNNLHGYMEEAFNKARVDIEPVLAAPSFLTLFATVARAPLVTTVPAIVAQHYAPMFGLATSPLPFAFPSFPVQLIWHARSHEDSAHQWLRQRIERSAAAIVSPGLFQPG